LVAIGAAVLQILPLPRALLDIVSPSASRVVAALALKPPDGALPLSIDATDSATALALFGGMVLVFFTARQIFENGGVRTFTRGLAIIGLVLAGIAIAQEATGGGRMYWRWTPTFERTHPFGPFVNRNHFGTWAIVATALCLGYLAAHLSARQSGTPGDSWRTRLVTAMDGRAALLLAAASLMIVAVVLSLSRSSMIGLPASLVVGMWLSRHRAEWRRLAIIAAALVVVTGTLIILRVPPAQVMDRVTGVAVALEDRLTIWRETVPIIREFWLTGTGVGTYQTAMAVFQQSDPGLIYNQAHNHYLQVAAEGGLLVGIPVAILLWMFARETARALARDRSGIFWLRVGAASGLAGVAAQSVLETGLLTPANGVLVAIAAAVVLHAPRRAPGSEVVAASQSRVRGTTGKC
jgi:O-antigen ligase